MSPRILLGLLLLTASAFAIDDYRLGPDSFVQDGVPRGEVESFEFNQSSIFPGTSRQCWLYTPAQYDPAKPACVMIYLDGGMFENGEGKWRAPVVMDNLIHRGEMPVTIGIFVNPGSIPPPNAYSDERYNRSFEYDGVTAHHARFLFEELIPTIERRLNLSRNPDHWGIAGSSSGAIAAFMAAWHRPDRVRRVISAIGTYVDYKAGGSVMTMARKGEPRPLRVFLQEGMNDKFNYAGNWPLANQDLLAALTWAGYEVNHEWGDGGHNSIHAGSIFPKMLTWLWKDWEKGISTPHREEQEIYQSIVPGEKWEVVYRGEVIGGLAANATGEVFVAAKESGVIKKLGENQSAEIVADLNDRVRSIAVGGSGEFYASVGQSVVRINKAGVALVLEEEVEASDLHVDEDGLYATLTNKNAVLFIPKSGKPRQIPINLRRPACLSRFTDHMRFSLFQMGGQFGHLYETREPGQLLFEQPFHQLQIWEDGSAIGGSDCGYDVMGRLFVATDQGVQILNPQGRAEGLIMKPNRETPVYLCFGGPGRSYLYVATKDKVYRRLMRNPGYWPFNPPIKSEKRIGS